MKAQLEWFWAWHIKERSRRARERVWRDIAWILPRELVMWCAVRLMAHATTGKYGDTEPDRVSIMDALNRWNPPVKD